MVKMHVTHFATTVAHQILALVTNIRCHDFSALGDLSPKMTMSCSPMHTYSVGYTCTNQIFSDSNLQFLNGSHFGTFLWFAIYNHYIKHLNDVTLPLTIQLGGGGISPTWQS